MDISVIKLGEDRELDRELRKQGYTSQLIRGAVRVLLTCDDDITRNPEKLFENPLGLTGTTFYLEESERGGAMTNTGTARIVCGQNGEKLTACQIMHSGNLANGIHAWFREPDGLVTIDSGKADDIVNIQSHLIEIAEVPGQRRGSFLRIKIEELWRGDHRELPSSFSKFSEAVKAAAAKGECFHCREVHFALRPQY